MSLSSESEFTKLVRRAQNWAPLTVREHPTLRAFEEGSTRLRAMAAVFHVYACRRAVITFIDGLNITGPIFAHRELEPGEALDYPGQHVKSVEPPQFIRPTPAFCASQLLGRAAIIAVLAEVTAEELCEIAETVEQTAPSEDRIEFVFAAFTRHLFWLEHAAIMLSNKPERHLGGPFAASARHLFAGSCKVMQRLQFELLEVIDTLITDPQSFARLDPYKSAK